MNVHKMRHQSERAQGERSYGHSRWAEWTEIGHTTEGAVFMAPVGTKAPVRPRRSYIVTHPGTPATVSYVATQPIGGWALHARARAYLNRSQP